MKRAFIVGAALGAMLSSLGCNPPINGAPCSGNHECPTSQVCTPGGTCEPPGGPGGGGGAGGGGGSGGGSGKADGQACTSPSECSSNACQNWYEDSDGDGVGKSVQRQVCGATPPSGFSATGNDCCDADNRVFPGQTQYFDSAKNAQCTMGPAFDFNCDTQETYEYPDVGRCFPSPPCHECALGVGWATPSLPACGGAPAPLQKMVGGPADGGCTYTQNAVPVNEKARCR